MSRAQSPSKLTTLLCEAQDYHSSDSPSPSLKQTFQSETDAEYSEIVVMPVMTIGTNNLEKEMAAMKATLERLVKESEVIGGKDCQADQKVKEVANLIPYIKLRK